MAMIVGSVARLWRYPVKSMLGEAREQLDLEVRGFAGDRRYAVRTADGFLGSGKNTHRFRAFEGLLNFQARYRENRLEIRFPDGSTLAGDDARIADALSAALGAKVTLERAGQLPHVDAGSVHILSSAALAWLEAQLPGHGADERRFRPNIVVHAEGRSQVERSWMGRQLRIGDRALLKVTGPTERCRMTTLPQDGLPAAPEMLRAIAQEADAEFGVYAEVLEPGRVAIGDAIRLGA
jgi:uncharacterized protein YcbX